MTRGTGEQRVIQGTGEQRVTRTPLRLAVVEHSLAGRFARRQGAVVGLVVMRIHQAQQCR